MPCPRQESYWTVEPVCQSPMTTWGKSVKDFPDFGIEDDKRSFLMHLIMQVSREKLHCLQKMTLILAQSTESFLRARRRPGETLALTVLPAQIVW